MTDNNENAMLFIGTL